MTIIVNPNNDNRVLEHDKLHIQFFDKKRQTTTPDLQTINVKDDKGNQIYDLYVEISNIEDPYTILCKKVEGSEIKIYKNNGAINVYNYKDYYKKAFAKYNEIKTMVNDGLEKSTIKEYEDTIEKLKADLAKAQALNEKPAKQAKNTKQSAVIQENEVSTNELE